MECRSCSAFRIRVLDYDAHDDLLDAEQGHLDTAEVTARRAAQAAFMDALRGGRERAAEPAAR
jgi:hypothetical protein